MPRVASAPYVARYSSGGKNSKWVINGLKTPDGKRFRLFFPRREKAEAALEQFFKDPSDGTSSELAPEEIIEAARCIRRLAPFGKTLTDATDELLRRFAHADVVMTVSAAVIRFREAKDRQAAASEIRPRYAADLRNRLDDFSRALGGRSISSIRPVDIDKYLDRKGGEPATRNGRLRMISVFFSWCVLHGITLENPATRVPSTQVLLGEPCVLSPSQVSDLLNVIEPDCIPTVAIAAFAGVRSGELRRLDWSSVKLSERVIVIGDSIAKTGSHRSVPVSSNLVAWLSAFGPKSLWEGKARGKIVPVAFRRKLEDARDAAGLIESDGSRLRLKNHLRHSFGSYRLPVVRDARVVALEMGSLPDVFLARFKNFPNSTDVDAWWAIAPSPHVRVP